MLHVEVSTMVEAPPETVLDVYADWSGWSRLFPTISGVRLLRREGAKLVLEVDHVEGRVINELVVRPPDTLELLEEKRRYDTRFSNRSRWFPVGRGSRHAATSTSRAGPGCRCSRSWPAMFAG